MYYMYVSLYLYVFINMHVCMFLCMYFLTNNSRCRRILTLLTNFSCAHRGKIYYLQHGMGMWPLLSGFCQRIPISLIIGTR